MSLRRFLAKIVDKTSYSKLVRGWQLLSLIFLWTPRRRNGSSGQGIHEWIRFLVSPYNVKCCEDRPCVFDRMKWLLEGTMSVGIIFGFLQKNMLFMLGKLDFTWAKSGNGFLCFWIIPSDGIPCEISCQGTPSVTSSSPPMLPIPRLRKSKVPLSNAYFAQKTTLLEYKSVVAKICLLSSSMELEF